MEKMVKMNNEEINDAVNTLVSVINAMTKGDFKHTPDFSYVVGRNLRLLRSENSDYIEQQQQLIREYGEFKTDEEGRSYYSVNKEDKAQYESYQQKLQKLSKMEHESSIYAVSAQKMQEWALPFEIESVLWFLLDEDTLGL